MLKAWAMVILKGTAKNGTIDKKNDQETVDVRTRTRGSTEIKEGREDLISARPLRVRVRGTETYLDHQHHRCREM